VTPPTHIPDPTTATDESLATWVWGRLAAAADEPNDPMHLHVLCTTDERTAPDARLMVLRGASRELNSLWYHADATSTKVKQIERNAAACVVIYDRPTDTQIRVHGDARIVQREEDIRAHWQHIRSLVQQLRHDDQASPPHDLRLEALNRSDHDSWWKPDHFAVIAMHPKTIDVHLPHAGHPRRRSLVVPASQAHPGTSDSCAESV
jgi:hypothetical protein